MLKKKPIIEKIKSSQSNVPVIKYFWSISTITPDEKGINTHKVILLCQIIKIIEVNEYTHNPSGSEKYTHEGMLDFIGLTYWRKIETHDFKPRNSNQWNIRRVVERNKTYKSPPVINGEITCISIFFFNAIFTITSLRFVFSWFRIHFESIFPYLINLLNAQYYLSYASPLIRYPLHFQQNKFFLF